MICFFYFVYRISIKRLWYGFQWWYVVTRICLIWLDIFFYCFIYHIWITCLWHGVPIVIYKLFLSLNFDLENNLIFSLLLSMSWYKFDDKLFYLFYYLILLKLENVFIFSLGFIWEFIREWNRMITREWNRMECIQVREMNGIKWSGMELSNLDWMF